MSLQIKRDLQCLPKVKGKFSHPLPPLNNVGLLQNDVGDNEVRFFATSMIFF